jgi:hypothetical protein
VVITTLEKGLVYETFKRKGEFIKRSIVEAVGSIQLIPGAAHLSKQRVRWVTYDMMLTLKVIYCSYSSRLTCFIYRVAMLGESFSKGCVSFISRPAGY